MSKLFQQFKALNLPIKLSRTSRSSFDGENDDEDINQYMKEIRLETRRLLDPTIISIREKEDSIKHLGRLAYTAGHTVSTMADVFLPPVFNIIKDHKSHPVLVMASLRTVALACLRCRTAKELLFNDKQVIKRLMQFIDNADFVNRCRWACYALELAMTDNHVLMSELKDYPRVLDILKHAADYPRSWAGWGCNLGDLLLKMLALRDPARPIPEY